MPIGHTYHTGIRRDENLVWRRSSDGAEVELEYWDPGDPHSDPDREFLYWEFYKMNKNMIGNYFNLVRHFICEY